MIAKYRQRISGPILDRVDLFVPVSVVEAEKLAITRPGLVNRVSSKEAKTSVVSARKIQEKRFATRGIYTNSQMHNKDVKKYCQLTAEAENLLKLAADKFDFSARSYFRLIKVARTIADLENAAKILTPHMAEALQYRQMT